MRHNMTAPPVTSSMTSRRESSPKRDPASMRGSGSIASNSSWRSRRAETESATRVEDVIDLNASDDDIASRPFIFIPGITGKALCLTPTKTSPKSTLSKSPWPSKPPMFPSSRMSPKPSKAPERGQRSHTTIVSAKGGQDAMSVSSHHSVISDITMLSLTSRGNRRSSSSNRRSKSTPRSIVNKPESLKSPTSLREGDRRNTLSPLATPSGRKKEKLKSGSSMEPEPSKSSNRNKQYSMATTVASAFDAPSKTAIPREFRLEHSGKPDIGLNIRSDHSREQRRPARRYSVEPTSTSRYLRKIDLIPSSSPQSPSSFHDDYTSKRSSSKDSRLSSLLLKIDMATISPTPVRSRTSRSQSSLRSDPTPETRRAKCIGASSLSDIRKDAIIGSSKRSGRPSKKGRSRRLEREDLVSTSSSAMTTKKKKKSKSHKTTKSSEPLTPTNESRQKKTMIEPKDSREERTKCPGSCTTTLDALMAAFPREVRRQLSVKSEFGLYTTHQSRQRSLSRGKSTRSVAATNFIQNQDVNYPHSPCTQSLPGFRETSTRSERTSASTSNLKEPLRYNSPRDEKFMYMLAQIHLDKAKADEERKAVLKLKRGLTRGDNSTKIQEYMKKYAGESSSSVSMGLKPKLMPKPTSVLLSPNGVVPEADLPWLPW
jgi:hypothetical protein